MQPQDAAAEGDHHRAVSRQHAPIDAPQTHSA
jgi:hypothetical protein